MLAAGKLSGNPLRNGEDLGHRTPAPVTVPAIRGSPTGSYMPGEECDSWPGEKLGVRTEGVLRFSPSESHVDDAKRGHSGGPEQPD
jgi:hypothetical protein